METLSKLRLPIGSMLVDATMIFFIAWWGSGVTSAIESLNERMAKFEALTILPGTDVRLTAVETRMARSDADRSEIIALLQQAQAERRRIEDKIDRHDRQN